MKHPCFAAIDFETADTGSDSACAVGIVRVQNGRIRERFHCLIRPPRPNFVFTYLHNITWGQVSSQPDFGKLWPRIQAAIGDAEFLAAHNARFDRKVLESCCRLGGIPVPSGPFVCTVELARRMWSIFPTQLPMVCDRLGITLNHHEALSDAEACARIVLTALKDGWKPPVAAVGVVR
jgi:DNA polymerase-3 subunit epsilon